MTKYYVKYDIDLNKAYICLEVYDFHFFHFGFLFIFIIYS
jgi:hypothetical protein